MLQSIFENKRGQNTNLLTGLIVGIFVAVILLALVVITNAKFMEVTDDGNAIDILNGTNSALDDIVDWLPLIIIAAVIAVVIGYFAYVFIAVRGFGGGL